MIKAWPCWIIRPKTFLVAAESSLFPIVVLAGWGFRGPSEPRLIQELVLALLTCQIGFYFSGLDRVMIQPNSQLFLFKTIKTSVVVFALTTALFHFIPGPGYSTVFVTSLLCALVVISVRPLLQELMRRKALAENLLIIGRDDLAIDLCRELGHESQGLTVSCEELSRLAVRQNISKIVVAHPDGLDRRQLVDTLVDCKLRGVAVEDAVDFYERLTGKIWLKGLQPEWLVYCDGFRCSRAYPPLKRLSDVTFAFLLIVATAPLLLIISLLIKLDSPGAVLFKQERVGAFGRRFILYKFRSMSQEAESATGPMWARPDDARVTRIGRIIRNYRLDEIPQAFNVLRGEMSFIGPRPERACFVELLREQVRFYDLRHYVKPGITGWAQVVYRYGASVEDAIEKLQYDIYYMKHMSVHLDFLILLKTFKVVFFGRGR